MTYPPKSTDNSNSVCLFVGLSYFLTQTLCPDSPPLLHNHPTTMLIIMRYTQARFEITMNVRMYEMWFSLVASYPSSSSKEPSACFHTVQYLLNIKTLSTSTLGSYVWVYKFKTLIQSTFVIL